jgi:hypothetical protein
MAAPWHLTHMDVGNVSMMYGTSLTMPSQHLWKSRAMDESGLNQKCCVSMTFPRQMRHGKPVWRNFSVWTLAKLNIILTG